MNFVLDASLFQGSSFDLLRLLATARDGRHRFEVREEVEENWQRWRDGLDADTAAVVVDALEWSTLENALRPSGVVVSVAAREQSAWSKLELTLADAVDLASRPFRVFVENAASDGRFVRAMLTTEERAWFDHIVEREWLLLQTAGGVTELEKCVRWATHEPSRRLRAAALFDGDAVEEPRSQPEADADFLARLHRTAEAR